MHAHTHTHTHTQTNKKQEISHDIMASFVNQKEAQKNLHKHAQPDITYVSTKSPMHVQERVRPCTRSQENDHNFARESHGSSTQCELERPSRKQRGSMTIRESWNNEACLQCLHACICVCMRERIEWCCMFSQAKLFNDVVTMGMCCWRRYMYTCIALSRRYIDTCIAVLQHTEIPTIIDPVALGNL